MNVTPHAEPHHPPTFWNRLMLGGYVRLQERSHARPGDFDAAATRDRSERAALLCRDLRWDRPRKDLDLEDGASRRDRTRRLYPSLLSCEPPERLPLERERQRPALEREGVHPLAADSFMPSRSGVRPPSRNTI